MDSKVSDLLDKHRVCSLTVMLPDGSPHAAALHYSHRNTPVTLFFSTENTSKKTQGLLKGEKQKASVVVGFSEEEWITLQMDGEVKAVLDDKELEEVKNVHYAKHPDSKQYENNPATIFLSFVPSWWRFSDYNTDPPTILASEE